MTVGGMRSGLAMRSWRGENIRRRTKRPKSPVLSRDLDALCAEGRGPGSSPGQ